MGDDGFMKCERWRSSSPTEGGRYDKKKTTVAGGDQKEFLMISSLINSLCDTLTSLFGFLPIPGAGGAVGGACMDIALAIRSVGL